MSSALQAFDCMTGAIALLVIGSTRSLAVASRFVGVNVDRSSNISYELHNFFAESKDRHRGVLGNREIQHNLESRLRVVTLQDVCYLALMMLQLFVDCVGKLVYIHNQVIIWCVGLGKSKDRASRKSPHSIP